jgi:hypothetical protein
MGCMSASDAAPLPRLGEVFFDVRGSSRSMRLSWYADTGVAVFSIWQGGMCTGTFRLAISDLPRMVETLEQGPGGQELGLQPSPAEAFDDAGVDDATRAQGLDPLSADELPDYRPGPPDYGPGPSLEQHPEQPDYRAAATEYLAESPDPLAGSGPYPTRALDYPAGPEGRRAGPADYPAEPPDPWNGPADYAPDSGRNGHLAGAGLPGYGDRPPPDPLHDPFTDRRPGSSYPGPPPEGSYPAHPGASYPDAPYPGGRSAAPYPGPRSDAPFPGGAPDVRGSYPGASAEVRGSYPGAGADVRGSYPGASAEGPYPGTHPEVSYPAPSDGSYPGPLPGAPFPGAGADARGAYPGGPAGGPGSAGRGAADYPAHYGAADGDDLPPSPPPESFPYGQPPGNRGPGGRHADPDTPFD